MAPPAVHSKLFARASLLLIGLAWTLPFLQPRHRYPLTGFYGEWLAFGIGLAAAYGATNVDLPLAHGMVVSSVGMAFSSRSHIGLSTP